MSTLWQADFDPAMPPTIVYTTMDSYRPQAVCSWRWWGPRPEYDVLGWIVRHESELVLERFSVVPYGSFDDDGAIDEDADVMPVRAPVSPAVLREVPLARLLAQVYADLTRRAPGSDPEEQWARHVLAVSDAAEKTGRPEGVRRRLGPSDALLRQVAELCIEQAEHGRGLWRRIGDELGESEGRVRDLVRAARTRGYLAQAEHGKRSVQPGPRLLEEMRREHLGGGFEYESAGQRAEEHRRIREAQDADPTFPSQDQPPF